MPQSKQASALTATHVFASGRVLGPMEGLQHQHQLSPHSISTASNNNNIKNSHNKDDSKQSICQRDATTNSPNLPFFREALQAPSWATARTQL
mmetsp:Transcript_4311/g.9541  ORF Transcript_4311/g.9541 Transcript_4311/m.9541 type:complete len:93 (+) Transcript_4311:247-525(+)